MGVEQGTIAAHRPESARWPVPRAAAEAAAEGDLVGYIILTLLPCFALALGTDAAAAWRRQELLRETAWLSSRFGDPFQ